jgi:thymidylate synthase (FAD)
MRIVQASYTIEMLPRGTEVLKAIERAGRTCYKSEDKITDGTAATFVQMLIKRGHHAMLEHGPAIAVKFVEDRGVSHETVRHRLFSFAQESTRYCNYAKEKFGEEITVVDIRDFLINEESITEWLDAVKDAERRYFRLIELGNKPQMARSVLPNSLKTEIVVTGNPREWRHFFTLRAAKPAHPQMRELACPLLKEFRDRVPILFDDVGDPDCG